MGAYHGHACKGRSSLQHERHALVLRRCSTPCDERVHDERPQQRRVATDVILCVHPESVQLAAVYACSSNQSNVPAHLSRAQALCKSHEHFLHWRTCHGSCQCHLRQIALCTARSILCGVPVALVFLRGFHGGLHRTLRWARRPGAVGFCYGTMRRTLLHRNDACLKRAKRSCSKCSASPLTDCCSLHAEPCALALPSAAVREYNFVS
jgi:hypothetical protein